MPYRSDYDDGNIVDFVGKIHAETPKAILVSLDGEKANAKWIPKSQLEHFERVKGMKCKFSLPEWLAVEKEFV